jgi:hypothetical protein
MADECPQCGLRPEQDGNPSGSETCGQCGKGIWIPAPSKIGKARGVEVTMFSMIERNHNLETELFKIRCALKEAEGKLDACQTQLRTLLYQPHAERDHLTSCDRIMGATHPCTCHADEYRALLEKL